MSKSTTEIERKYIAKITGPIPVHGYCWSTQGYIVVHPKWEWRIRKMVGPRTNSKHSTERWFTAIKIGNGFIRREFEWKIPSFFGKLLMKFAPEPILKYRTHSHGWEIDEFHLPMDLRGLVLAEVEIPDANSPLPPHPSGLELIEDVTDHGGYSNKHLYKYGLPA